MSGGLASRKRGFLLGTLAAAALAAPAGAASAALPKPGKCERPVTFDPAAFSNPTKIDHPLFPLTPGTRFVLEGTANRGLGPLPHRVVFTVTDLTKVVGGVRSVVIWDVDSDEQGNVQESELSFFARDDAGNVWNLGEMPEEFQAGVSLGAPSTWIAGLNGAEPGIHMLADPQITSTYYLQGSEQSIDFEDCARVLKTGQTLTDDVSATTYDGVLVTEEFGPLDPAGGFQLKYHAPGIGIVRVEPVNDPEGETLRLAERRALTPAELADARRAALDLDTRGYGMSPVYSQTPHAEAPPSQPPPEQPQPPVQPPPGPGGTPPPDDHTKAPPALLTAAGARARVRRTLVRRLGRWRIGHLSCRLERSGRARCTFTATRRGSKLRGGGAVTLRSADTSLHYRLTVRVTKNGCRPTGSRRCTRKTTWRS